MLLVITIRRSSIRHYLATEATNSYVNALVNCHLDYCNSLFVNLLASQLFRVQRAQNNAPILITRTSMHAHITPVLMGLHWLPVASRIQFKLLVLAYRYVIGLAPMGVYARTMRQHNTNASIRRGLVNLHLEQQHLDFGIHRPQTFVIPRR